MDLLISDTSVLIDLERGALLTAAFRLPYRFVVPDLLYERELKDYGGEKLIALGLGKREAAARIPAIVEASGLDDAVHRRVSTYSNGMQARLCFWTAMNLGADLMLIDEVLAVDDAEFRRKSGVV